MRSVTILGATGSIGTQAIDVIRRQNADCASFGGRSGDAVPALVSRASTSGRFAVDALAAGGGDVRLLAQQAAALGVSRVGLADESKVGQFRAALAELLGAAANRVEVLAGPQAATILAGAGSDVVLNGITGSVGLRPTLAALAAGSTLALANKESLVVGGPLVAAAKVRPDQIVPVDSEHSAIAQCLRSGAPREVHRIILTASGGPFRGRTRADLAGVTPTQALAHPTWDMGPVVTINSASLMNKGLELIEAHLLFDVPPDDIAVVVHPQSVVHSMVEFRDGSTIAQASPPDMRLPIALGLSWPQRLDSVAPPVDWTQAQAWTFEPLDDDRFPAVRLARAALAASATHPAVYNAANEQAVAAFLAGRIGFLDIVDTVERVLGEHQGTSATGLTLADVEAAERWARARTDELLGTPMSTRVLYLHGIGNQQRVDNVRWLSPINAALQAIGREPISAADVVHPIYADLWAYGTDEDAPARPTEDARYAFIDRQSRLSDRLYPDGAESKRGQYHEPPAVENLVIDRGMSQVRDFLKHHWHPQIRQRILDAMGDPSGDWLIFGHSLGTAVALEFLTDLPPGMRAPLVLTAASPLGRRPFRGFVERCFERIDFDAVGNWLNVYNIHDIVPGGHGFSTQVPQAVNYVVQGMAFDHSVATPILPTPVANEIGIALYGPETKDVGPAHIEVQMGADLLKVIALQYAWHIERLLKESDSDATRGKGARFGEARNILANQLSHAASLAHSPLTSLNLTGDLAPALRGTVTRMQAARIAVAICAMNPIAPFEIDVKKEILHRARRLLAHDLGWNHTFIDHAHDALGSARLLYRTPLMRWVAVSAPTISTSQGPAGLSSGSAALGGLAALGPGGMAGLLALTNIGEEGAAAASTDTFGLAIARLPTEELEEAVIEIMASARTTQMLKLAGHGNFSEWSILNRALIHAREDDEAIVRLSDKGAAVVKSAGKRVESLEKATHWLAEHHLAPDHLG